MQMFEGIDKNLRFMVVEVGKQLDRSFQVMRQPSRSLARKIYSSDNYIDTLKSYVEKKTISGFRNTPEMNRQTADRFRALVTVAIAPIAPEVFWWLLPVVCGWLLSPLTDLLLSSERIGGALAGAGILATAEETALPPVLEQRSALITRYEALAGIADPIRTLALDPEAARRHLGSVIARPLPHRGAPNAAHLMAEAKIGDARNLDEALGWLERTERLEAIADPVLMQALCDLPAARRLTSAA